MLINIKPRHFHSSINHKIFIRTLITSYFRSVNIAKFLRTAFLYRIPPSSRFQMFFKISVLKSTQTSQEIACVRISFLKMYRLKACNFIKKSLQHKCFPLKFAKFLRTPFFTKTPPVTASALRVAASIFFKKSN